jgi:putative transposase
VICHSRCYRGSRVIEVDPAYTSQRCSACGAVDAASRISRSQFLCTGCGLVADADRQRRADAAWLVTLLK